MNSRTREVGRGARRRWLRDEMKLVVGKMAKLSGKADLSRAKVGNHRGVSAAGRKKSAFVIPDPSREMGEAGTIRSWEAPAAAGANLKRRAG